MSKNLEIAIKIFADSRQAIAAISKMETGVVGLAKNLTNAFGAQALSAMKKYAFEAANLNKELMRIAQVTGTQKTGGAAKMNEAIFAAAKNTGLEYNDILSGYGKLASAGIGLDEIKNSMENISKAAVVSKATTEQLGNAVLVASKSFNLDMKTDSLTMLDKMYKAGKLGNAELDSLSTILGRVGPMAKLAGLGLEETLAFIEGMASSMESEEVVATMSKSVMKMFNDPKLRKAVQQSTGAQFFNADGSRNSVFDILSAIQDKFLSFDSEKDRSRFFESTFGNADERTKNGLLSILNADGSINKMRDMFKDISGASGEINRDMSELMNNMQSQTNRLKATWAKMTTGAGSSIDKSFAPVLKSIADFTNKNVSDKFLSGALLVGGGALAIGGALGKFGALKGLLGKGTPLGAASGAAGGILTGKVYEKMGITPVYIAGAASGVFTNTNNLLDTLGKQKNTLDTLGKTLPFLARALPIGAGTTATLTAGAALAALPVGVLAAGAIHNWGKSSDEVMKERFADGDGEKLAKIIAENNRREELLRQRRESLAAGDTQTVVNVSVNLDKDGRNIDMKKYEFKRTLGAKRAN